MPLNKYGDSTDRATPQPNCSACGEPMPQGHAEIFNPKTGERWHPRCEGKIKGQQAYAAWTRIYQRVLTDEQKALISVSGDAQTVEQFLAEVRQADFYIKKENA